MDEEELQRRLNQTHWTGRAGGLEDFAEKLRDTAGIQFSRGNDVSAGWHRTIALMAENQAAKEREYAKRFDEEERPEVK